jgi:hypothetical protein
MTAKECSGREVAVEGGEDAHTRNVGKTVPLGRVPDFLRLLRVSDHVQSIVVILR